MRAFPKIIPNPQILRWAQWFYPYIFQVKHLKEKTISWHISCQGLRHFQEDSKLCPTRNRKNRPLSFGYLRPNMVTIGGWKKDIQDHLQHLQPLCNRMTPDDMCKKLPLTRQGLLLNFLAKFVKILPRNVCQ